MTWERSRGLYWVVILRQAVAPSNRSCWPEESSPFRNSGHRRFTGRIGSYRCAIPVIRTPILSIILLSIDSHGRPLWHSPTDFGPCVYCGVHPDLIDTTEYRDIASPSKWHMRQLTRLHYEGNGCTEYFESIPDFW